MYFDFPTYRRQQIFVIMMLLVLVFSFIAKTASFYHYKITYI